MGEKLKQLYTIRRKTWDEGNILYERFYREEFTAKSQSQSFMAENYQFWEGRKNSNIL